VEQLAERSHREPALVGGAGSSQEQRVRPGNLPREFAQQFRLTVPHRRSYEHDLAMAAVSVRRAAS
jgi:hypothetical protein